MGPNTPPPQKKIKETSLWDLAMCLVPKLHVLLEN